MATTKEGVSSFFDDACDEVIMHIEGVNTDIGNKVLDNFLNYHLDDILKFALDNMADHAEIGRKVANALEDEIMEQIYDR